MKPVIKTIRWLLKQVMNDYGKLALVLLFLALIFAIHELSLHARWSNYSGTHLTGTACFRSAPHRPFRFRLLFTARLSICIDGVQVVRRSRWRAPVGEDKSKNAVEPYLGYGGHW